MSETAIKSIEKEDIKAPRVEAGGTAIVFQRHEKYDRARDTKTSGSIFEAEAEATKQRDEEFFREVLESGDPETPTYVFFMSSDTQYNNMGRRSLETAELAQDACIEVMESMGIDPTLQVINLNPEFNIRGFTQKKHKADKPIRPVTKIREPNIFGDHDNHRLVGMPKDQMAKAGDRRYFDYMQEKYGDVNEPAWSPKVWAVHESDGEAEMRIQLGAEGVYDILDRTKRTMAGLARYAEKFHATHPNARLVIWAASHYDTISPLVKDTQGVEFTEYLPVDYGAGVVINIPPNGEAALQSHDRELPIRLGETAVLN